MGDRAEDVVQEAYVHLLRRTRTGIPHSPRPWLHSVVSSLCLRELNRRRRHQPTEIESLAAPAADPAELAQTAAELRWALAGVASLPDRERASVIADLAGIEQGRGGRTPATRRCTAPDTSCATSAGRRGPSCPSRSFAGPAWAGRRRPGRGGGASAPAAIATGGVAKGALVAAATVVALAGGHVVASLPTSGHPVHALPGRPSQRRPSPRHRKAPPPSRRGCRRRSPPLRPPGAQGIGRKASPRISGGPPRWRWSPPSSAPPAAASVAVAPAPPSAEAPSAAGPAATRGTEPARPPGTPGAGGGDGSRCRSRPVIPEASRHPSRRMHPGPSSSPGRTTPDPGDPSGGLNRRARVSGRPDALTYRQGMGPSSSPRPPGRDNSEQGMREP